MKRLRALLGEPWQPGTGGRRRVLWSAGLTLLVFWAAVGYALVRSHEYANDDINNDSQRLAHRLADDMQQRLDVARAIFETIDLTRAQIPDPFTVLLIARPASDVALKNLDAIALTDGGHERLLGEASGRPVLPPCDTAPEAKGLQASLHADMLTAHFRLTETWQGASSLCAKLSTARIRQHYDGALGDTLLVVRLVDVGSGARIQSARVPKAGVEPRATVDIAGYPLRIEVLETDATLWQNLGRRIVPGLMLSLLITAIIMVAALRSLQYIGALENLATSDGLTGLFNRRHFLERANLEWQRHRRRRESMALLLIDVDFFKKVNDTYGHDVGDDVLRAMGKILPDSCRGTDLVARYGGEEFIVVFATVDRATALMLGERIRAAVEASTIDTAAGPLRVTCSGGLAAVGPGDSGVDVATLITRADSALYAAKAGGRNRIVVAEGDAVASASNRE